MARVWMQLPGPAGWVATVVDELRAGRNVVLCVPEYAPADEDLRTAIRLGLDHDHEWRTLRVPSDGEGPAKPVEFLFSSLAPRAPGHEVQNVGTLLRQDGFGGCFIWLDGIDAAAWPTWRQFLTEYSHACRATSLLDRTVFCVLLRGGLALEPPTEDVCLALHRWHGVVESLDAALLAAQLVQGRGLPRLQKRVTVAIVAQLAQWDLTVVERLALEDLQHLLDPVQILQEIARERQWSQVDAEAGACTWHRGMADCVDAEMQVHSAILALRDPPIGLERRLWTAQVGVLLPFVEEQRQGVLIQLGGFLTTPFKTRFGYTITDIKDLEIGHIKAQIVSNGLPVPPTTRNLVQCLVDIRNALAHLERVPLELLLATENAL